MLSNITRTLCRLYRAKSSPSIICHAQTVSPISIVLGRRSLCSKNDVTIEPVVTPDKSSPSTEETIIEKIRSKHVTLNEDVIKELTGGDAEKMKRLKLIDFEYQIAKQEGKRVPSSLSMEHWKELLDLPSYSGRQKYMVFRFKNEMTKIHSIQKKEKKKLEPKHIEPITEKDGYGLGHNSFSLRIYDASIDHWRNARIVRANMFDQPVVFDFGYHNQMTRQEQKNAAKQLVLALKFNREHEQPLPMQFCNVDLNSSMINDFEKLMPNLHKPEFPIHVSTSSYLDLYPREKIVYLTPHCNADLEAYNSDSVYIIGALVDKANNEPLTLAKAKRDGVKMRRLPLDQYLTFKGGKCLTLNAMMAILLDMRFEGDWRKVLERHIPRRKIKSQEDFEEDERLRQLKFRYQKKNRDPINMNQSSKIDVEDLLFPNVPKRTAIDLTTKSNNRDIKYHSGEMFKKNNKL